MSDGSRISGVTPPRRDPEATSAVHGTKETGMVQFSFRPPGADYLGFEATAEGISETACKAEELGFDAVLLICLSSHA